MRTLLLVLLFLPVQTLGLEWMRLGGVKPDLALVLVVILGLSKGPWMGLLWGSVFGTLVDLFGTGTLGAGLIAKAATGMIVGGLGRLFVHMTFWAKPLLFFAVSILHDGIGELLLYEQPLSSWPLFGDDILRRALYGSVIVLLQSVRILREPSSENGRLLTPA